MRTKTDGGLTPTARRTARARDRARTASDIKQRDSNKGSAHPATLRPRSSQIMTTMPPLESQKNNRTVVITGGTGGIGFYSALGIARTGARVIITGRNKDRGEEAVARIIEEANNPKVELVIGDVSSLANVDALSRELLQRVGQKLDVLVNNAGYLGNEPRTSSEGLEQHFATNVVSPWRLTYAMLPALKAAGGTARVINLSAGDNPPQTPVALDVDNLQAEKGFKGLLTMAHSKSVMEAMTVALARELESEGVKVNVVFPGRASTAMTRSLSMRGLPGPMKLLLPCLKLFFKNDGGKGAAKAATSTIWAATSDELEGVTGRYFGSNTKECKMPPKTLDPQVHARIVAAIEVAGATPNRRI